MTLYRALLQSYPDHIARHNLGNLLRELRRFDEAAKEYEEVIRVSPRNAPALINLATARSAAGRTTEALAAYEAAFEIEPAWRAQGNLNHEYGFALVQAGRADDASKVFALMSAAPGEHPRGLRSQALLDLWQGKYAQAEPRLIEAARLNEALKRGLSVGRDLLYLAILRDGLGDTRGSLAFLDRAVGTFEKSTSAAGFLSRAGVMYVRFGELTRARRVLDIAQRQLTETPTLGYEVRRFEGELIFAGGERDRGIDVLAKADAELGAIPALTKESLGYAYERAGRLDPAIEAYTAIKENQVEGWEPQQAWLNLQYRLAALHAKRGERDKAAALLDRLLDRWQNADPNLPLLIAAKKLRGNL